METTYRVWYAPYGYPDESDFVDVQRETEKEAREFAASCGYVQMVEVLEHR